MLEQEKYVPIGLLAVVVPSVSKRTLVEHSILLVKPYKEITKDLLVAPQRLPDFSFSDYRRWRQEYEVPFTYWERPY